jgi:murein L,D-transpeptidase YafK
MRIGAAFPLLEHMEHCMKGPHIVLLPWLLLAMGCQPSAGQGSGPVTMPEEEPVAAPPPEVPLARMLDSLQIPADDLRLLVEKDKRTMSILAGDRVLKQWPCVLGEVPLGDKMMQGDRRTPEGTFTFRDKYPHHTWHKFVWIDYPNADSRRRFNERKQRGEIPAHAAIGGEIGIHGVPEGMDHWIMQGTDWTFGCIALRNADLDEIYPYIRARHTLIEIVP